MSLLDGIFRRAVTRRLAGLRDGQVHVHENGASRAFGNGDGPVAHVRVADPRFYREVALGGHIGAAEGFMDGRWTCDDLPALVRVLVRNRDVLEGLEAGWARLAAPLRRAVHALRRNTRAGSRRNIRAHYDLGNEFFRLFLDETLTYSCAYFETPDAPLADASRAKYDRLCRLAGIGPGDRVVEIGSGWGGFALHAAQRYGCRVTTTTISSEQLELARRRVAEAGLADRVTVLFEDYRALSGTFDRLVSIEMIEAVGHAYYDTYFAKCAELLRPGGRMALQAIVIRDELYDEARREVDFIKRYVFPGSCIPSVAVLRAAAGRAGLTVARVDDITEHYPETLRRWRAAFLANRDRVRALGFDDAFLRLWEFYFCYCEGGFLERTIGDVQMELRR